MHYLKVTPAGANAIDRLVQKVVKEYGDLETAIAGLEILRQQRKNKEAA